MCTWVSDLNFEILFLQEFQDFHKKLDVDTRRTTAYHPQSNGLVEAHNKILKT